MNHRELDVQHDFSRGDIPTVHDLDGAADHAAVTETVTAVGQKPTTVGHGTTVAEPNCGDITTVAAVSPADADDRGPAGTSVRDTLSSAEDDVVIEVTEAEFHASVSESLARLGLTYAELEDQARRRDFTSAQAHSLWVSVGGAVRPELLTPGISVAQKATKVPRVIGLDLSLTCTGVAGEGWTDVIRPKAGLRGHPRLAFILDRVADHIRGAELVVIEGPSFGGGVAHRHEDLAGLRVMARHACWRRGIPYALAPPSCRALYATGKGSGAKGAVRDAVRERYGIDCDGPGRYDQADAYVLCAMGLHHLGWPLTLLSDTYRRGLDGCQWPDTEGLAA